MLASFTGGNEIVNAYEAGLSRPELGLVAVKEALSATAIQAAREAAAFEDPDQRINQLQETLYNEIPLAEAEALINDWASTNLPEGLRIFSSLESPVAERRGMTVAHFDTATAPASLIHGPFAISIGTVGRGIFQGLRLPIRLTDAQLLGDESSSILDTFEKANTTRGLFNLGTTRAQVEQNPGDIILIPGSPHPALHSVEVPVGTERASVISSYVITLDATASASELRQQKIADRKFELNFMLNALRAVRS